MMHPDQEAMVWRIITLGIGIGCAILFSRIARYAFRAMAHDIDMGL